MIFRPFPVAMLAVSLSLTLAMADPIAIPPGQTLSKGQGPRPTADEVLDGKIPGRPAPLPVEEKYDAAGFAADRLYHVPAPGQHPRVMFSAEDLPRIRKQLADTATGRQLTAQLAKAAGVPEDSPALWVSKGYQALAAGDGNKFNDICMATPSALPSGPPGAVTGAVNNLLFYRILDAELRDDKARGKETATAIAGYAQWLRTRMEAAAKKPGAEAFWLELRGAAPSPETLGFLYDLGQPYMTVEQAGTTRDAIVFMTQGRYGLGMDLPRHWRRWNFIGMGLYFPLMELSIEGEPGFDQRIVDRGAEVARDYFLYSLTKNGVGREAVGYQTAGLAHTTELAIALANRGRNILTLQNYRHMLDNWLVWAMQPYGRHWQSGGDLGTFPPSPTVVRAGMFFYPDDAAVKAVGGQCEGTVKLGAMFPQETLVSFLCPVDLGTDSAEGRPPELPRDKPLAFYEPERGILFARSAWTADAAALQLGARSDTIHAAHDHPDRGDFYFTALGQPWSVSSMREVESKFHSIVMIDGTGQGFFAPPARWIAESETPEGVFASIDTSYCYDWRWMKTADVAPDSQLAEEPWMQGFRDFRDRLLRRTPLEKWERDPLPQVVDYYKDWLAGDPRMWGEEDTWVLRTPYNPVRKSFRAVGFFRQPRPFMIIADDIRKDDAAHLYEWHMILPSNVEPYKMGGADIILGPVSAEKTQNQSVTLPYNDLGRPVAKPGAPMLLVRILRMTPTEPAEDTPPPAVETMDFLNPDPVEQFQGRSFGVGKRLVLPTRCVEPRYRVLLYPFRSGEKLPETTWQTPDELMVATPDGSTAVTFTSAADGHSEIGRK